jgi:hypothetical protein
MNASRERAPGGNGDLSDWSAQPKVVPKPNAPPDGEMRLTFNYRPVKEDIPATFMKLTSEIHDYLSHPSHGCFIQLDFKHAFWSIGVYPPHRHYLAFHVDGFGQLQPTRMPQGTHTSTFSLQECLEVVFGPIPPLPEHLQTTDFDGSFPSLLQPAELGKPQPVNFYADDIVSGSNDFEQSYKSLREDLLPRIEWSMLKLSFKKVWCFEDEIEALGVRHRIHGVTLIKHARAEKIRRWPTPQDSKTVRSFLATVECTRRWVKNYANIAAPLTLLLGRVEFFWKAQQQLAFEFLRDKCSMEVESHGIDPVEPVEMYSDASDFAAGCCIMQKRLPDGQTEGNKIAMPLLFDSFVLNAAQKRYPTWKKELLAIHDFAMKYQHLMQTKETKHCLDRP